MHKDRSDIPVDEQREATTKDYKMIAGKVETIDHISEIDIQGKAGKIFTILLEHDFNDESPVIIFYHGGGFVVGHPISYEHIGRYFARELGARFYIPDYRLAPEHPFPAAIEDAYSVLEYVAEKNPGHPIVVMGDSAGANLAAVVSILARDRKGPSISHQVLNYPWLNPSSQDWPSYKKFGTGYMLEESDLVWFAQQYLPLAVHETDTLANPYLTEDLRNLPQTLIITAQFDPLHDEGAAYADKLKKSDNKVQYSDYSGMVHGFFSMDGLLKDTKIAWREVVDFISKK